MQNAVHWFSQVLHLAMFWAAQYFPKYAHKLELARLYNKMLMQNLMAKQMVFVLGG